MTPRKLVAAVAERVIEVDPIETGDELARIGFADALGRALATPEREIVERPGKRAPTPAEIDADQLEAVVRRRRRCGLAARLSIVRLGEVDVQALQRFFERLHVVVAALRGVVPAVDEQDHERITCDGGVADRIQRPVGLIGLPEPALVVRFDEVEIEPLVHDRGFVTEAIRFVQVAGAAGDKRRRDCERGMNMWWPHGVLAGLLCGRSLRTSRSWPLVVLAAQFHAAADRQQHRVQVGLRAYVRLIGRGRGARVGWKEHVVRHDQRAGTQLGWKRSRQGMYRSFHRSSSTRSNDPASRGSVSSALPT